MTANMKKKIEYTSIMQQRIIDLQNSKKIKNKEIAQDLSISIDQYSYLKRTEGSSPQQKMIDEELLYKLCEYFDCTLDYICGESDDINKDKNGRTITNALNFFYKQDFHRVHQYLDQLDYTDKILLMRFLTETPSIIKEPIIAGFRKIVQTLVEESISTLIASSSNIRDFRINARDGLHDKKYIKTFVTLQTAEAHIGKKRYKDALRTYIEAIRYILKASESKEIDYPLIQLYDIACDGILGLHESWNCFPNNLGITELIKTKKLSNYCKEDIEIISNIISSLTKKNTGNTLPPE